MPTPFDAVRLCCCFDGPRADLLRRLPATPTEAAVRAAAPETEHSLPLRPEVNCLQRWLDLNA
jgi:hypothetical protein